MKNRREILSSLQSGLDHRLRSIPRDVRLNFTAQPTAVDEPPAPIAPSTQHSLQFVEIYEWLKTTRLYLAKLQAVHDHDIDTQLAGLLCKVDEHVQRLTELQQRCWDQEKVDAGLYNLETREDRGGLMIFDPGKPAWSLGDVNSTDYCSHPRVSQNTSTGRARLWNLSSLPPSS